MDATEVAGTSVRKTENYQMLQKEHSWKYNCLFQTQVWWGSLSQWARLAFRFTQFRIEFPPHQQQMLHIIHFPKLRVMTEMQFEHHLYPRSAQKDACCDLRGRDSGGLIDGELIMSHLSASFHPEGFKFKESQRMHLSYNVCCPPLNMLVDL